MREKHFTKGKTNSPAGEQRRLVVHTYPGLPSQGRLQGGRQRSHCPPVNC